MKHIFEARVYSGSVVKGLVAAAFLGAAVQALYAVSCPVVKHGPPSDADKAMLAGDFAKAESLYQAALAKQPGDTDATIGLVHSQLHQQKVPEAEDTVNAALEASPKSAAFVTLRGELEFRQGKLWLVEPTVIESYKVDPCNARTRLLFARIAEATARYAIARQQIALAHQFDPEDPEIRLRWIETLPLTQRVPELETFLATLNNGLDPPAQAQLRADLSRWKAENESPGKACRLVSGSAPAEIPFIRLAGYLGHPRAFGFAVGLNAATARLQLDTRGAGISVYRSVAERAGLKRMGADEKSAGPKPNYAASADSVKIGGLEFKDCVVNVIDSASPFEDGEGTIGVDTLSDFLVTLDFPIRKVTLAALPPRAGDTAAPRLHSLAADFTPLAPTEEPAKPAQSSPQGAASTPALSAIGPFDRAAATAETKDYAQIYQVNHDLLLPTALGGDKLAGDRPSEDKIVLFVPDASIPETGVSTSTMLDLPKAHEDKSRESAAPGGRAQKVFVADDVSFNFAHLSQKLNGVASMDTAGASAADGAEVSGLLGMNTTLIRLTLHIDFRDGLLKAEYVPGRGSDKME